MEKNGRVDILYSRVKQLTTKTKSTSRNNGIKDSKGNLLTDSKDIKNRLERVYRDTV